MNPKTINAEIVEEEIVTCKSCGQKNRLYKRARHGVYRCGACHAALSNPFLRHSTPKLGGSAVFGWAVVALLVLVGLIALLGGSGQSTTPSYAVSTTFTSTDTSSATPRPSTATDTALRRNPDGSFSLSASALTEDARRAIATLKQQGRAVNAELVAAEIARARANAQPPLPTPANGEAFTYTKQERVAPFEIKSSRDSNYLVKLADAFSGQPVLTVFVRGGETVNIDVPLGTFTVKYASGDAWYGYDRLFGEQTGYSKSSKHFTFERTGNQVLGYTITLYKVPYGNLHTERIKPSEF